MSLAVGRDDASSDHPLRTAACTPRATDPARREELLKEAQRIVARDAVNGFLFQLAKIGVWKKDLVGLWENSPTPQLDLTGVYWK